MDNEEKQMFDEIAGQIKDTIEGACDRYCIDSAFLDFKLTCTVLSNGFKPMEEITLLDTSDRTFCDFCGKKTNFYDRRENLHICASCYGKFQKNKEK
jgi:hypothetical protein